MDLSFSDADLAFQTKVRTFIDEHVPKGQALWTKRSEWFKALADQGDGIFPSGPSNLAVLALHRPSVTFLISRWPSNRRRQYFPLG